MRVFQALRMVKSTSRRCVRWDRGNQIRGGGEICFLEEILIREARTSFPRKMVERKKMFARDPVR